MSHVPLWWSILWRWQHLDSSSGQTSRHSCEKVSGVDTDPWLQTSCDQPPHTPVSIPSPTEMLCVLLNCELRSTLPSWSCFCWVSCSGNYSGNGFKRLPRKYLIQIWLKCLYCNTSSHVTGSLKSGLGQRSKYFVLSVCVWTGPLSHLYSEPRFLPSFRGPSVFPAAWAGTTASPRQPSSPFSSSLVHWPAV